MEVEVKVIKGELNELSKILDEIFRDLNKDTEECKCENKKEPKIDPQVIKDGVIFFESINRLSEKLGISTRATVGFLDTVTKVSEMAAFSIILKEIAITLDKKYKDHIRNSEDIYVISSTDGKIKRIPTPSKIRSFKHFAAFRNIDDARTACRILKDKLKEMFRGEQED